MSATVMAEDLPQAVLVHTMTGRTRLRIAERRGDSVFFAALASGISTFQGVQNVDVTPLTGSVLIRHDVPLDVIAKAAWEVRLFAISAAAGPSAASIETSPADLRTLAALGFGALALLQIGRGQVLPQAATLAWYAATLSGLVALTSDAGADGAAGGD